jgi:O-antigen/teichoic acid export membrane protein
MGIVRKQSIASSIYIYIGFLIGAFNLLFLFKNYFTPEEFGLTRLLIDVSTLLAMLCTFGSCPATIKFFPFYKAYLPPKKNDLPFLTIVACLVGCILFLCITPIFKESIIRKFGKNSALFVQYFHLIYPLTISYAFWYLLESIEWSLQNTVLTNFLKEIGFRLITTILIGIYILQWINFNQFIVLFSFMYIIPVLILIIHLYKLNYFNFSLQVSKVTKRLRKHILTFSIFIFSGQVLGLIARTSDTIIISSQSSKGLSDTAVFTIATFLIALMEVPMRGMMGIAASIIAYAWKDKDMLKIEEMYKKTALNLTIIGLAIGCVIFLNAHNLVSYFIQCMVHYQP